MQIVIFILAAILAYIIKPMFFGPVQRLDAALVGIFIANYVILFVVFTSLRSLFGKNNERPEDEAGADTKK